VDAADETYGARRERRLVIAEVSGSTRKSDGKVVNVHARAKISNVLGSARNNAGLVVDGENVTAAINDSDGHGAAVHGKGGILDNSLNFNFRERRVGRRRWILLDGCG
jgi:hypothetical protein